MVKVFKYSEDAVVPTRANPTDIGWDLYANETLFIPVHTTKLIKTGVAIEIPNGYLGKILTRSSLGSKGIEVGAGVIDPGYAGEIKVVLHNLTNYSQDGQAEDAKWNMGYHINKGDKIAQLVLIQTMRLEQNDDMTLVNELWNSDRGSKNFGSSGR